MPLTIKANAKPEPGKIQLSAHCAEEKNDRIGQSLISVLISDDKPLAEIHDTALLSRGSADIGPVDNWDNL